MLLNGMRRATALFGCALMGGCALLNPYVKVDNVHIADAQSAQDRSPWQRSQNLLKSEHDSAQKQADAYRSAAIQHSTLKTGLAVTQVPLNAAIVAAAATNDRSDFPLIGGITSAAALSLGGLLSSPARQAIYLQAQTATLCAMAAYDIYFIDQNDYTTYLTTAGLQVDILAVSQKREALKAALLAYDAGTADAAQDATTAEAKATQSAKARRKAKATAKAADANSRPKTETPQATTAGDRLETYANAIHDLATALMTRSGDDVTAATATKTSLEDARGRVDEAGRMLGDRRMAIKTQVDQNIQTTELTFDQIKAAISASALASTQPTPSAPPAASDDKAEGAAAAESKTAQITAMRAEKERASPVIAAMKDLETALDTLNQHRSGPDAWLRRHLAKERTATQVGTCTASAHVVLTATPANPAQVSPDKPLQIQIHAPEVGGAPTFTKPEDGLNATMTTGGGYDYTLTISEPKDAKPTSKDQTIVISSGTQSVRVPFTVSNATGGAKNPAATQDPPARPPSDKPSPSDKPPPKADG